MLFYIRYLVIGILCFILLGLKLIKDFTGCTVDKNLLANTGDTGLIPGLRRFRMLWSKQACVPQLLSLSSRAPELQLPSLQATTTEAPATGVCAGKQEKPAQSEK